MSGYTCGICGHAVGVDVDHVEVKVEKVWFDDRNEKTTYLAHTDCARSTFEGWRLPA